MTTTQGFELSAAFIGQQLRHRQLLIQTIERRVFSLSGPELQRMVDDESELPSHRAFARNLLVFLPDELHLTPMEVRYDAKQGSLSYRFLEGAAR